MKRILPIIIIIAAMLSVSAQKRVYRLNVGRFDKVKVTDNVNVVYRSMPDSTGMAVFEGEEEFANAFIFSNSKGKLRVQVNTEDVNSPNLPTLYLYSDYLTAVENSSEFMMTVENNNPVPSFSVKQIGNGKIVATGINAAEASAHLATGNGEIIIRGKADTASYKMVGTGKIEAVDLEAFEVRCTILGTGEITCWPTQKLDVRGIGTTDIYYKGTPEIKKVGGGKIFPIAEKDE